MTAERVALLEASVAVLREKLRGVEEFRTSAEGRLGQLEGRSVRDGRSEGGWRAGAGLDGELGRSELFLASLRRVEGTAVGNARRVEEWAAEALEGQQARFLEVEQRLLAILSQKEQVLRNLTRELESQGHVLRGLQDWVAAEHSRPAILDAALTSRLDTLQQAHELRLQSLHDRLDAHDALLSSAAAARKRQADERDELGEEVGALRKEVKRRTGELEQQLAQEVAARLADIHAQQAAAAKAHQQAAQTHQQALQQLQDLDRKLQATRETLEAKLAAETQARQAALRVQDPLRTQERMERTERTERMERMERAQEREMRQPEKTVQYYDQREVLTTPQSQERMRAEVTRGSRIEDSYRREDHRTEYEPPEKKPLPPRKNLFTPTPQPEEEQEERRQAGGIRGLLQKSKEKDKDRRGDSAGRPALNREKSSGRGLPPVREDPLARRRKEARRVETESEQEVVYEIDEEGYLMDQEGNYLLNEHGEMIRLSPEEIQQYIDDPDA